MSLVSSSLHTTFPVTIYDHNVIAHSPIFSRRHNNTKIPLSRDNNPTNVTPLGNSFIAASCTLIGKRPTRCVTKQTSGSTHTTNLESEKKQLKWDFLHETNLLWFLGMIVLGASAPFVCDPDAVYVAVVLFFMSGYGLTLGYHRLLSHRGFKVPKWLEYFFAYCGAHAVQRDPIFWVRAHKLHHKYSDTDKDPYTPTEGVWCSYLGWFLYNDYIGTKGRPVDFEGPVP